MTNKCYFCGNEHNVQMMEYGQYQCVDLIECLDREYQQKLEREEVH